MRAAVPGIARSFSERPKLPASRFFRLLPSFSSCARAARLSGWTDVYRRQGSSARSEAEEGGVRCG
eukprot:332715-Hanusia_phi.AAC.1